MTYTDEIDQFLSQGSGAPALKFPAIGTAYRGRIVDLKIQQQKDLKGKPKTFDSGEPMKEVVVSLTDVETKVGGNWQPVNDDEKYGRDRRWFAKGGNPANAIREALKDCAPGTRLTVGGTLAVAFSGETPATKAGYDPAKQFKCRYEPPVHAPASVSADDLL